MEYEDGFYWVKITAKGNWVVVRALGGVFRATGAMAFYLRSDFHTIGPKIEEPSQ
jgi:hypothetical protein